MLLESYLLVCFYLLSFVVLVSTILAKRGRDKEKKRQAMIRYRTQEREREKQGMQPALFSLLQAAAEKRCVPNHLYPSQIKTAVAKKKKQHLTA